MQTTLLPSVKQPGHSLMVTGAAGLNCSRLFYIHDNSTGLRFLVDTGTEVSVVPPSRSDRKQQDCVVVLHVCDDEYPSDCTAKVEVE